ncbi:alpha/beta hydrolase [Variovorax sp. J31P207]|uniref:alpha/beta hydrolase n=1 Tax=Variovorax sp. J31P207 TaxID=3053510 RepID=UPI0025769BD6|nr:alpha/beta hydrolase [Variovorax sp. J31P207]MDM0071749.1 alpha/beta hydrolase [Variovorax sp. J31P207]
MKISKILVSLALSSIAIAGAQAETYEGVHPLTSSANRADVAREAVNAAHAGNVYGEAAGIGAGAESFNSIASRAVVRAEAVAKARENRDSLDRRSFYRDQVPAQFNTGLSFTRQASR